MSPSLGVFVYARSRSGASSNAGIDGESLQADVMRFMAIIGFCLVAIMALVRDVNPPSAHQLPEPTQKPMQESVSASEPAPEPEAPIEPVIEPQIVQTKPALPKPVVVREVPFAAPVIDAPKPLQEAAVASVPNPVPVPVQAEPEEGLSLRFHSDRDFLRLITSGEVGLYLFKDQTAFRLAKNYAFQEAPAPHQLYELMPQTIPAAISASADAAVSHAERFKWGVVMPAHIERRIASLVALESNGQLVIDRFGAVRLETADRSKGSHALNLGGAGLMRVEDVGRWLFWLGAHFLFVLLVFVLGAPAFAGSPRGSSGELFGGELGRWLENDAIPELSTLVGKHPRFRGEQIRVVSMEGGRPALGSNQLSAAVRDQLTHRLTRIKNVRVAWQTTATRCGVPRHTPYLLGVEITSESRSRSLVTIAMVDVEEGIWVSGGYLQWRGTLTQQERDALARMVAVAPAGTIEAPLAGGRHKQITAVLLSNIECSLRGGLDGSVQIVVADTNDDLLMGVSAQLREALTRSATITLVDSFTKEGDNTAERADWLLQLRASSDVGEAVVATLAQNKKEGAAESQRLAAVYVRRVGASVVASTPQTPAVTRQQATQAGDQQQAAPSYQVSGDKSVHSSLIDQLHEVPAQPGDRCYMRSAGCLEVQFDLTAPSYLLVLRTQPSGSLNLGSCSSPRKMSGTKRYRLQVRQAGAGFYAVATTDLALARRLHRQLVAGATNCGDRGRGDWLDQLEATLASAGQALDWRAFHIPARFGDDLYQPDAIAVHQLLHRPASTIAGEKSP